jgi:hypothetical protein
MLLAALQQPPTVSWPPPIVSATIVKSLVDRCTARDVRSRACDAVFTRLCAGEGRLDLITNDIDHEKIHTGQVLEGRYESRITASPMQRLVAEWLAERARFIGSLVGLTDEQFNSETAPGEWRSPR